MTASFLNGHAGIVDTELANSAAYLQGWIDALKSKDAKGWIIRAASQAQKAADLAKELRKVEHEAAYRAASALVVTPGLEAARLEAARQAQQEGRKQMSNQGW